MPLIYGKTGRGFASDLADFFKTLGFLPSVGQLTTVGSLIIQVFKKQELFDKVNLFISMIRAVGGLLFDCDELAFFHGDFYRSRLQYNKEVKDVVSISR